MPTGTQSKSTRTRKAQGGKAVVALGQAEEVKVVRVEGDSTKGKGKKEEDQTQNSISQEEDLVAASRELEVNQVATAQARRELTEATVAKNSTKEQVISVKED